MPFKEAELKPVIARQNKPVVCYSYTLPSDFARRELAKSGVVILTGEGRTFSAGLVVNFGLVFFFGSFMFVLTLLLTPYILSRLDVRDFGTWVLMTIFISAFNPGQVPLFDLGGVFMKYISEYYTYEDYAGINRVLV